MYRRIFALILAFVMVFSLLPGTALAAENAPETEPVVTEPVETEPAATEPVVTEPKATQPAATEPVVTEPQVTQPQVTEPVVTEPVVTEPVATEPEATEPVATEPVATEPEATEPEATEPEATEPEATEPEATEPVATEPEATEPVATEPVATEPVATEPVATEPVVTEPVVTEPVVTEPEETEPQATQPVETQPAGSQQIKFARPGKREIERTTITAKFSFEFPEDSGLTEEDIGSIAVVLKKADEEGDYEPDAVMDISANDDWMASFELMPNTNYRISVDAYFDGYVYSLFGDKDVNLEAGETDFREYTIIYTEDEEEETNTLTVSLVFAEDSAFGDGDIGEITANIYADDDETELVRQLPLTQENGREATATLPNGQYIIEFSGYEKEGYLCGLEGNKNIWLVGEDNWKEERVVTYVKNEATLTVSLAFAEDSAFGDGDIGEITANIYADDGETELVRQLPLTQENGRTATATLPNGQYIIEFSGYEKEGYLCGLEGRTIDVSLDAGGEWSEEREVNYVKDEATLTVSLAFAEDSAFGDADIGKITAYIYSRNDEVVRELPLTQENGRTATATLPSGYYDIEFSGYEKEGYFCGLEETIFFSLNGGDEWTESREVNYVKDEATLTVSLAFAEGSAFGDADIGEIAAKIYDDNNDNLIQTLSLEQGSRTATTTLPSGDYYIEFSGYEKDGHICGLEEREYIYLPAGEKETVSRDVEYVVWGSILTISLALAEDSQITEVDLEQITVEVLDGDEIDGSNTVAIKRLNSNGVATFTLESGDYYIRFSGYENVEGYRCRIDGDKIIVMPDGEHVSKQYTIGYVKEEAKLTVSLNFAEDSAFGDDDIGDITAEIYDDVPEDGGELVETLVLTKENDRMGEVTVSVSGYDDEEDNWISKHSYYLKLTGGEKEGYRALFTGADYPLEPEPGTEGGWNVIAKYVEAEHDVTVRVRLSEDSDVPAAELKNMLIFKLSEINDGMVAETATHTGSAAFAHTFTNLPASDCYRLKVNYDADDIYFDAVVQSVTFTGDELYRDLEEGQLDFVLDGDCEIEVVICAKKFDGELTVIARFTEDSALQAEDFPEGITLVTTYQPKGADDKTIPGKETVFTQETNWTETVRVSNRRMRLALLEHPAGYVGTVTLSGLPEDQYCVNPEDCPTTVYADICFVERKPYYLDVEIVFAEDSALKSADAGSIFLNITDSGTERNFEFKEGSWHQTVALQGDLNAIREEDCFGMALSGLARDGYSYTVRSLGTSDFGWEYGGRTGILLHERGETKRLVLEVCYVPQPGKLVVDIISSPYGMPCPTTITVKDADGNIVAQSEEDVLGFATDLPEVGTYTVSQTVTENSKSMMYFADGDKTIRFDPDKGATVTLLNEYRRIADLTVRKFFEDGSVLDQEDFPEGVTVTLTEASGTFGGTYILSDDNGWSVSLNVPAGSYTATETGADRDGFARTTRFVFTQSFYDAGSAASLRDWGLRGRNADNARASTTYDAVGGPYYLGGGRDYNSNFVDIYNTYERAGSVSFTAGDGFYNYPDEQLPGSLGSGYEAEEYQYTVVINGEEQTVTLKSGETYTLENLPKGTEYSVTPVLPDDYGWNADNATVTGAIGEDLFNDESWDVELNFENLYYYDYEDGVLTIVKTDDLTGEGLEGAVFGLYTDAACTERVATATSGAEGICTFAVSEAGTYYIKELEAPTHYHVLSEQIHTATVTAEWALEEKEGTKVIVQKLSASVAGLSEQDGGFVWVNERRTGSITITAGDGFWIYDGEQLPGSLGSGYEAEEYRYTVVINGQEQTVTLKPGQSIVLDGVQMESTYSVTPVLPDGYTWNNDGAAITGTIGSYDEAEDNWDVEVSFENLYYYAYGEGTLTIIKTDELTGKKLKGATFGLYADAACSKLITSATTNRNGICTFKLTEEGKFYIKELKAPTDYHELDTTVRKVTVKSEWTMELREGTKVIAQQLVATVSGLSAQDGGFNWVNERKTTDIRVAKIFAHDEDLERPDHVIAVLYRDGVAYDSVKLNADNNWYYVWEDMPLGFEYTIDEAEVAEGYYKQIRSDGYDFTIINSGAILPQTGDESMIIFWTAMALVSLCGIAMLMEKKRLAR